MAINFFKKNIKNAINECILGDAVNSTLEDLINKSWNQYNPNYFV